MHMVAVGIGVAGCDPRRAQGWQTRHIELRHDDRVPNLPAGAQTLRQRECHVHHPRTIRQPIQPVAKDDGFRLRDRPTYELGALAQVIVRQDAGGFVEGVVGAHRSGPLHLAEGLSEVEEEVRQMLELLRRDFFSVEGHTDLTDKSRDCAGSDLWFQSLSADKHSAALRSRRLAQRFQP
ncbi:hypothetical protein [Pararhodobacter sp. CCB-MM2]|uniref:hypothetical protein n=1 Tax=Pararhodobacter sp. CCB-MM2 TaxID=1786003 RepID=UPI0011122901|nr:hypothetical protein [Pararhodobacter sp. CCB-MM2]